MRHRTLARLGNAALLSDDWKVEMGPLCTTPFGHVVSYDARAVLENRLRAYSSEPWHDFTLLACSLSFEVAAFLVISGENMPSPALHRTTFTPN